MNKVPEIQQPFYYWLCENVSNNAANLWLNNNFEDFIKQVLVDSEA